jgi:hypothetical protein
MVGPQNKVEKVGKPAGVAEFPFFNMESALTLPRTCQYIHIKVGVKVGGISDYVSRCQINPHFSNCIYNKYGIGRGIECPLDICLVHIALNYKCDIGCDIHFLWTFF